MDRETYRKIHNIILKRHSNKRWDYSWFYDRILDKQYPNIRHGWFINTITKYLQNGMKILDVCGGVGMFGAYLQTIEEYNFDYVIMDLQIMKEVAEDYLKTFGINGKFVVGNITHPCLFDNFQQNSLDMVWLFSWCQIQGVNCEALFSEIYRMLKPDGIFMFNMAYAGYAVTYNEEALRLLLIKIGFKLIEMKADKGGYANEYFVAVKK